MRLVTFTRKNQRRLIDQGAGYRQTPLLAARKLIGQTPSLIAKPDSLQHGDCLFAFLTGADA